MSRKNENAAKSKKGEALELLEIIVDESQKNKYKITLPLSYDLELFPSDANGKSVPVSSIGIRGTHTTIKSNGSASQWRFKILKPAVPSPCDPTGQTSTVGGDEDGFKWLRETTDEMEQKNQETVQKAYQAATRQVVFLKVEK